MVMFLLGGQGWDPPGVGELGQLAAEEQEKQLHWPRETLCDVSWWPHKSPVMQGGISVLSHAGLWLLALVPALLLCLSRSCRQGSGVFVYQLAAAPKDIPR